MTTTPSKPCSMHHIYMLLNTFRPPAATAMRNVQRDLSEAVVHREQQPAALCDGVLPPTFFLPTSFLSLASQIRPCTSNQINGARTTVDETNHPKSELGEKNALFNLLACGGGLSFIP